jgi:hypothetical protein
MRRYFIHNTETRGCGKPCPQTERVVDNKITNPPTKSNHLAMHTMVSGILSGVGFIILKNNRNYSVYKPIEAKE